MQKVLRVWNSENVATSPRNFVMIGDNDKPLGRRIKSDSGDKSPC